MRKILLVITLALGVTLSGCVLPTEGTTLTEAEIDAMIAEAISDYEDTRPDPLTTEQIETMISTKVTEALLGVSGELTAEEIQDLIEELLPENTVNTTYDLTSFTEAVSLMIDSVKTGILGLQVGEETAEGTVYGSGSGVIYKREDSDSGFLYDYYLVTNQHVVENASEVVLVFEKNGLLFQVADEYTTVLGEDTQTDLAVVKFTSSEEFTVVNFADSYEVELGDFVFAVGNPLGFDYYGTVTMGVLSGTSRYYNEQVEGGFDATVLQHDAAISPGNSGGALLDINGNLVGINFSKVVEEDVTGIGFAIPSNTVARITADLEDDGVVSKPYMGISTYAKVNTCGLDYGVCISDVTVGLPAEQAGIQVGDIIVGYMNEGKTEYVDILNFNDLREAILNSSVGETVSVKYIRDEVEYTTTMTLIERPSS